MNTQIDVNGVKITLTEEQLKQIADQSSGKKEKDMHDFMYNLTKEMKMEITKEKTINYLNLNNEFLFEQDYKNNKLWFSYCRIYSILENDFKLNEEEIFDFIRNWVDKHLNWKSITPTLPI